MRGGIFRKRPFFGKRGFIYIIGRLFRVYRPFLNTPQNFESGDIWRRGSPLFKGENFKVPSVSPCVKNGGKILGAGSLPRSLNIPPGVLKSPLGESRWRV